MRPPVFLGAPGAFAGVVAGLAVPGRPARALVAGLSARSAPEGVVLGSARAPRMVVLGAGRPTRAPYVGAQVGRHTGGRPARSPYMGALFGRPTWAPYLGAQNRRPIWAPVHPNRRFAP